MLTPGKSMTPTRAMMDPELFGPWFSGPSWAAWRSFVAALFALPMLDHEFEGFKKYTGRLVPLLRPALECWIAAGRRAGKSIIAAFLAVYLACFRDYREVLARGETSVVAKWTRTAFAK